MDTVGSIARDVAGLVTGVRLVEPSFEIAAAAPTVVGRIRDLVNGLTV